MAVLKKCKKNTKKEIFFDAMKKWKVSSKNEIDKSSKVALKWGFYCSDISIREELLSERRSILKKNPNFAIRALIGPNTKTEIINFLWENKKAYIHKIADGIGLSYQPVHREIVSLLRNGILDQEVIGRVRLVSLKSKAKQFFKLVPV
jgi:DNA-binding transcriptional ArsR family regulator